MNDGEDSYTTLPRIDPSVSQRIPTQHGNFTFFIYLWMSLIFPCWGFCFVGRIAGPRQTTPKPVIHQICYIILFSVLYDVGGLTVYIYLYIFLLLLSVHNVSNLPFNFTTWKLFFFIWAQASVLCCYSILIVLFNFYENQFSCNYWKPKGLPLLDIIPSAINDKKLKEEVLFSQSNNFVETTKHKVS